MSQPYICSTDGNVSTCILLAISLNMCFGWLKEPSHQDGSFECPLG